jgi:hypothetical protein
MQVFLDHVAASRPARVHLVMVLDGAGWHIGGQLQVPANTTLVFLPAYSPELNPVERVWLYLRERFLSLRLLPSAEAIVDACCNAWLASSRTGPPCVSRLPAGREPARLSVDGSPQSPGAFELVVEHGAPSAGSTRNPNSRLGRQARARTCKDGLMEHPLPEPIFVGIDVSKDRLDVHVRPSGHAIAAGCDGDGLERLAAELGRLKPALVVLEATGGFEVTVAAALAAAGRLRWSIPGRSATSPVPWDGLPRPTRSTPRRSRCSPSASVLSRVPSPTPTPWRWSSSSLVAASSSR